MPTYEWSHTNEAIENVRDNIFLLPKKTLREIWYEWNGKYPPKAAGKDALAEDIFTKAETQRICTSQYVMMDTAWICPGGCHTVSFSSKAELMAKPEYTTKKKIKKVVKSKQFSPQMAAILGYYFGESWTIPELHSMSITSDGFVVSISNFIGSAKDLVKNLKLVAQYAKLTNDERIYFSNLIKAKTDNWSTISLVI